MAFQLGDRVKVRGYDNVGIITDITAMAYGNYVYDVSIENYAKICVMGDWLSYWDDQPLPRGKSCTCGSAKVKAYEGHHTDWCDLYRKE
jgi:hypothetical protein